MIQVQSELSTVAMGTDHLEKPSSEPTAINATMAIEHVLQALPEAVYITDPSGSITFYNDAALDLWGVRPELNKSEFCGSWKLYWPDGTPLPHDESPMALALREKRPVRGFEAFAERPDGSRTLFLAFPTPIFDPEGNLVGAVNMLVDQTAGSMADESAQRYTAIIQSSDDAIVAKDLDGIISEWNSGAERLFGYTAEEAIGRPVAMLVPSDRADEEPDILARISRGERIDHFETIRRRKDGSLVEISLSVSPIRNRAGQVIGAAKIARDITERRRAEEQQHILIREMDHRVKNLFALASSIVSLSVKAATTPRELAATVSQRLGALAQAHSLTVPLTSEASDRIEQTTTLHALLRIILSPYDRGSDTISAHAIVTGPDAAISGVSLTSFALLLHEFATNAAKYGALSTDKGRVEIVCSEVGEAFVITWTELDGPPVTQAADGGGFGTLLGRATVRNQLGGDIDRDWRPEGLVIRLSVPRKRLQG